MRTNYWQKLEAGCIYHIYNRAIGKDNLFLTDDNYLFFLEKWKQYLPYLDVFAFCLMPNHFHFLVKVKPLSKELNNHIQNQGTVKSIQFLKGEIPYSTYLEDQFKRLFSSYALAFNKQQNRHGSLFQKRFKRIPINSEHKLLYLLAYVHHNPIHHHFCTTFNEWKYSSWEAFENLKLRSEVKRAEVLNWFDDDIEKALTLFRQHHETFRIDKKLENDTLEDD